MYTRDPRGSTRYLSIGLALFIVSTTRPLFGASTLETPSPFPTTEVPPDDSLRGEHALAVISSLTTLYNKITDNMSWCSTKVVLVLRSVSLFIFTGIPIMFPRSFVKGCPTVECSQPRPVSIERELLGTISPNLRQLKCLLELSKTVDDAIHAHDVSRFQANLTQGMFPTTCFIVARFPMFRSAHCPAPNHPAFILPSASHRSEDSMANLCATNMCL